MNVGAVGAPLRVRLLAADPLVRAGLARLLSEQAELELVEDEPEVTLLDAGPAGEGLELFDDSPSPVVALVADGGASSEAAAAGARGILFRDAQPAQLAVALRAVALGLVVREPELLVEPAAPGKLSAGEELTPREREVLVLVADGLSNKEIGRSLGISEHTAKFHVNGILATLGVERRTEAVVRAARLGLIVL